MKLLLMTIMLAAASAGHIPVEPQPLHQTRTQRPAKNPPQYPNIISNDGRTDPGKSQPQPETAVATPEFVRVLEVLAGELRQLVGEVRAMNVRQQAQLDMLRLTRGDGIEASIAREHRVEADAVANLEKSELNLLEALKSDNLALRASQVGTANKDETIRQMKRDLEFQLREVQIAKAQAQARELELRQRLESVRSANEGVERRLEMVEDALRQLNAPRPAEEKKP